MEIIKQIKIIKKSTESNIQFLNLTAEFYSPVRSKTERNVMGFCHNPIDKQVVFVE